MPDIDHKKLNTFIFPGPPLDPTAAPPSLPFQEQKIYTHQQEVKSLLQELVENLKEERFLGPFPAETTHLKI